jgi:hypothetical protein
MMSEQTFTLTTNAPPRQEEWLVLPAWALDLARQAVVLRAERKHCMLTVKFDGLSWQLFESRPVKRGGD